jgi:putative IMPACT (imprinted ancient) family translation regulator
LRASIYNIKDIHYLDTVEIETFVEEKNTGDFVNWITELTNGQAHIAEGELIYQEKDV